MGRGPHGGFRGFTGEERTAVGSLEAGASLTGMEKTTWGVPARSRRATRLARASQWPEAEGRRRVVLPMCVCTRALTGVVEDSASRQLVLVAIVRVRRAVVLGNATRVHGMTRQGEAAGAGAGAWSCADRALTTRWLHADYMLAGG